MNILKSLMARYLLLILFALMLFPLVPAVYYSYNILLNNKLYDTEEIEKRWQQTAAELDGQDAGTIDRCLQAIRNKYPDADVFWINGSGQSEFIEERPANIPEKWTFADSLAFMEERKFYVDTIMQNREPQDLYTTTALIGNDPNQGIMILQMDISKTNIGSLSIDILFIAFFLFICGGFFLISCLFFFNIRKRLVQLQLAMSHKGDEGIPDEVMIKRMDEIGRLEDAFNKMVSQLKSSKKSEQKEESLRKQLIANMSHDLRTPLTVMRQHVYSIKNSPAPSQGIESLQILENKLRDMDKMINNLLAYTLLSAGKHPIKLEEIDILDEVRKVVAEWYPIFEKHQFEIDIDLPEAPLIWNVDPIWFKSILDNIIQNVIRHANYGKYIGIKMIEWNGSTFIVINDRGEGFEHQSNNKGVGIGLSIVSIMMTEMKLDWKVSSSSAGTSIYLGCKKE